MRPTTAILALLSLCLFVPTSQGATVGIMKVTPKAYFVEGADGLFKPLDLKKKKIRFTPNDVAKCGQSLQRKRRTLSYSCTIDLPSRAKQSKLRKQVSKKKIKVRFGRAIKNVSMVVAADGRSIRFATEFDTTGMNFDVQRFNDDFFEIYSKSAQLVIQKAMNKGPLYVDVLESKKN